MLLHFKLALERYTYNVEEREVGDVVDRPIRERGDQILMCNYSLFSEEFVIHIQTTDIHAHTDANRHTRSHACIKMEDTRKDEREEKRNIGQRKTWENGKMGQKIVMTL